MSSLLFYRFFLAGFAILNITLPVKGDVLPGCADENLIVSIRNLIIANNKLPETTLTQFVDIKTLRTVPPPYNKVKTKKAELACAAIVSIVPSGNSDGTPSDTVDIFYGIAAKDASSHQIYFQPIRSKK